MKIFKEVLLFIALLLLTQASPRFRRDYTVDDYEFRNPAVDWVNSDEDLDYSYDDDFPPEEEANNKTLPDFDFNTTQQPDDPSFDVPGVKDSASVKQLSLVFVAFYVLYSMYTF